MAFNPALLGNPIPSPSSNSGSFDSSKLGSPSFSPTKSNLSNSIWSRMASYAPIGLSGAGEAMGSAIKSGMNEFQGAINAPNVAEFAKHGLNVAGDVAGGILNSAMSPFQKILEKGADIAGNLPGAQTVASSPYSVVSELMNHVDTISSKLGSIAQQHPDIAKALQSIANIGGLFMATKGTENADLAGLKKIAQQGGSDLATGTKKVTELIKSPFIAKTDEEIFATPQSQLKKLTPTEQSVYFRNKARQEESYFQSEQDKIAQSVEMTPQEKKTALQNIQQEQNAAHAAIDSQKVELLQASKESSKQKTQSLIDKGKALAEQAIPQASTEAANAAKKPIREVIKKAGTQYREIYGNEMAGKGEIRINPNEARQIIENLYPAMDQYGNASQRGINVEKMLGLVKNPPLVGETSTISDSVSNINQFNSLSFAEQNDVFPTLSRALQNEILGITESETRSPVQNLAHDIASGKIQIRTPKGIKTDTPETIGKGNYIRIFRNSDTLQSLDELANRVGITDNELVQHIKTALDEQATAKTLPSVRPNEQLPKGAFTTTLQKLSDKVLSLGQDIGTAGKAGSRVFTPNEIATQDAIRALVEIAKSKGLDLTESRAFWREWAPIRNKLVQVGKPYSPSGIDTKKLADMITAVASGKGSMASNNAELIKTFEDHLGYSLTDNTRALFGNLDKNEQNIIAEVARVASEQKKITSSVKIAHENITAEATAKKMALEEKYQQNADELSRKTIQLKKQQEIAKQSRQSEQSFIKRQSEIRTNIRKIVLYTLGIGGIGGEIIRRYSQ